MCQYGFYFPGDREWNNDLVRRARNNVRTDWNIVEQHPPTAVKQHVFDQSFKNFDSDNPTQFTFSNSTTVTTGEDFSQVTSWDISVNLSIPVSVYLEPPLQE